MHPYPPPAIDWQSLVCSLILPAAALIVLSIVAWRIRPVRRPVSWLIGFDLLWMIFMNLMVPGMAQARPAAERTRCKANLKVIVQSIHTYHDEHQRLPAPHSAEADGPKVSWRVDLMPYIRPGAGSPGADYHHARGWDDPANDPVARNRPEEYVCPSNRTPQDDQQRWYSAYALLTGPGTAFPPEGPLAIRDITDGSSHTLLVVEACGLKIVWTEPRDVSVSRETLEINAPGVTPGTSAGILSSAHDIGSHSDGCAQAAMADGSVRFLSRAISPEVLRKLTTAAGGEEISEDEF